jgi:hypothetical protein
MGSSLPSSTCRRKSLVVRVATREPPADRLERQRVLDAITQACAGGRVLEFVHVMPARKRSALGRVLELLAMHVAMVARVPSQAQRAAVHDHVHVPAVADASAAILDLDSLPARAQALKRTRARMPVEQLDAVDWQLQRAFEFVHGIRLRASA